MKQGILDFSQLVFEFIDQNFIERQQIFLWVRKTSCRYLALAKHQWKIQNATYVGFWLLQSLFSLFKVHLNFVV